MIRLSTATKATLAAIFLTSSFSTVAQDNSAAEEKSSTFTIDAQVMVRGELRKGGLPNTRKSDSEAIANSDEARFILERARLTFGIEKKWLEAKISVQHSGVWGQAGGGALSIYEAWGLLKSGNGLFAKFGRQGLAYDDERIIGTNDWAMAASSHDALKIGYEGHGHKVHAIGVYNQNAESVNGGTSYFNGSQPYKTMATLWYHYDFAKIPLGISVLGMNTGMQAEIDVEADEVKDATHNQQLVGAYAIFHPKRWKVEGSYYRQMGRGESGLKIRAWMASAKVQFSPAANYGFNAGYDYLSGDKYFAVPNQGHIGLIKHDIIRGFNPIYGSHHQFYGAMDFFYVTTFVNGFTPGLQSLYVGANYSPIKNLRIDASFHHYAITANLSGISTKRLGEELSASASYSFLKEASISAGFSFMKGSSTMEFLKRAGDNRFLRWGWISLNINPRLFTTKW